MLGDKVISLIVEPEVSSIDPSASISIGGLTIPGLQTRRASTTVELRDGESFAIAGLLRQDFQTTVNQIPILGSIPILGALFRSSNFQKGQTELMIVVTPRLVAPLKASQVRLPTDRVDDPRALDVLLDGEGYRPKKLAPIAKPPAATDAAPRERRPARGPVARRCPRYPGAGAAFGPPGRAGAAQAAAAFRRTRHDCKGEGL